MAKSDLQARPIYHRKRDSIEAHLSIVFAALAVSRWIERQTGWSIRKFVKAARRYRTIQIQADPVDADYSSVLVRQHAGTRGGCRRADPVCGRRGARSAQGRLSVRGAGAWVRQPGGSGGAGARYRSARTPAAHARG